MTTTIALAGKGGVGKTTVAAMTIKYLAQSGRGAIFAIDADPSSNLNMVLGLDLDWTVGEIREDMLSKVKESITTGGAAMGGLPSGMSKREHLDYEIRSSLSEGIEFDLIAMGRGEGRGCYCAVNHNRREVSDAIGDQYSYVVVDNEAGMEHLSRRTTRDVEHLLLVTDPSRRGAVAARRVAELVFVILLRARDRARRRDPRPAAGPGIPAPARPLLARAWAAPDGALAVGSWCWDGCG